MADINFPPLGQGISVYSVAHKVNATVTCVMDNTSYPAADYDWVGMYTLYPDYNSPIPAPYAGHRGTDIQVAEGSNIYAIVGGEVTDIGGFYNYVVITADDGYTYRYLHNSAVLVNINQRVNAGDLISLEGGYGKAGPNSYPSHLHIDRYETATGKVVDAFNIACGYEDIGGGGGGEVSVYVIVDSIDKWNPDAGKIGLWTGNGVKVKQGAVIHVGPNGAQIWMEQSNGNGVPLTVWKTECGVTMEAIIGNLFANRCQVGVYDQLGAFHPRAWINISDINW